MDFSFPLPLLEAYRSKKLALCIGSGLSLSEGVQGNFPTWKNLPTRFIDACARYGVADVRFIQSQRSLFDSSLSLEDMLAALGVLRSKLGKDFYQRALNDIFRPRDAKPGAVHRAIAQLGVRAVLTTNYDGLIEEVSETPRRSVFTWRESAEALHDLKEERPVLLKIHGSAERADTVVMTELEYHHAQADRPYQAVLSHLFQGYPFLFLGYGMNDPQDIDRVLRWNADCFGSASPRHYALMKQPSDKEPRGAEWDRYLREYNVQVLSYRDHGDLELIVEQFARSAAPNELRAKQEREGNKGAGSESASKKPRRPLKDQTSPGTALAPGAISPGGPGARAVLHDKVNQIREDLLNRNWPHREAAYYEIRESDLRGSMRRALEVLDEKWKGRHGPLEAKDRAMVVQIWADTKNWSRWDELIQLWSSEIVADSDLNGRLHNYFYAALASDMVWTLERIRGDLIALKASGCPERPTAGLLNLVSYVARKDFGKPSGKAWDLVAEIYEMFRDKESRFSFLAEIRRVLFPS